MQRDSIAPALLPKSLTPFLEVRKLRVYFEASDLTRTTATATCESGAIQAIAVSAKEPLAANPHASPNARLKRMYQHRTSKSGSSTPVVKVDETTKKENLESYEPSESSSKKKSQHASVGCCGRKPFGEEDEASSPASSTSLSVDGTPDLQHASVTPLGGNRSQTPQSEGRDHGRTSLPVSSSSRKTKSRDSQSHLLHDPANNGLDANGFQHGCNCGPDCSCLGCAAHPQNSTTVQYVKELYDYQADEATDSVDSFALSSPQANNAFGFDQALSSYQNDPNMLPPDLYFPYQLNLPGCENGGCRCGTNCTCSGCLTHSGHNGISNNMPNPIAFNAFSMNTAQPPQMTRPSTSSETWQNLMSTVASGHGTFSNPNLGFRPPMPPQPTGPNFMSGANQFAMPGNQRPQPLHFQTPSSIQQSSPMDQIGFQFGQSPQSSSAHFPPVPHGHPMNQYGFPTHAPNQSPIVTPTPSGPSHQDYGF